MATPEEKFSQQVWEILQNIKGEDLAKQKRKAIEYEFPQVVGVGIMPKKRRADIFHKLHEWGAIKILSEFPPDWRGSGRHLLKYQILQPKFDEVYEKYKKICESQNASFSIRLGDALEAGEKESVEVLIADLESKFENIQQTKEVSKFYLKLADYGKYLLGSQVLEQVLRPLYQEAIEDTAKYREKHESFIKKWKSLAKDLLKQAESAALVDRHPLENQINHIKDKINQTEFSYNDNYLHGYYQPYRELIQRFTKSGKTEVVSKKHLTENGELVLYPSYVGALEEWERYERLRENKVWWAHYQIMRLACGIFGLENGGGYFENDKQIDGIYKYEYEALTKRGNYESVYLKRNSFEEWTSRLHNFIIPRLRFYESAIRVGQNVEEMRKSLIEPIKRLQTSLREPAEGVVKYAERLKQSYQGIYPLVKPPKSDFLTPPIRSHEQIQNELLTEILKEIRQSNLQTKSKERSIKSKRSGVDKHKVIKRRELVKWPDDFRWEGKTFIFGKYGERSFNSKITRKMFHALTKAEGNWVTVKKLKKISNKNGDYVRQTLWQIQKSFKPKLKKHISIPSTTEDDLKPQPLGGVGAYRIKFTPKLSIAI